MFNMYIGDLIGIKEASGLVGVSRPTFDKLRIEVNLREFKVGRFKKFSKLELLQKYFVDKVPMGSKFQFCFGYDIDFDVLKIDNFSYDLRRIELIDGHCAIAFICHLVSRIKQNGCYIHLIFDNSATWLKYFNFFGSLKQFLNSKIFWDEILLNEVPEVNLSAWIKLPITKLGFVGAQTRITDDLTVQLKLQGYSDDVCAYIGWAMGELCDNSATHAGVHPCFVQFTQLGDDRKYLLFTIGDVGVGIPNSLRRNKRYVDLIDHAAVLTAFKPNVSGRDDEEKRGKGLTDVLKIAMECSSCLQVESNGVAYAFRFNAGKDSFLEYKASVNSEGTLISILFIDGNFASYDRSDVEKYINNCLEKI